MLKRSKTNVNVTKRFYDGLENILKLKPVELREYKRELRKSRNSGSVDLKSHPQSSDSVLFPTQLHDIQVQGDTVGAIEDVTVGVGANRVEVAGFVLWVGTFVILVTYIAWAYLPNSSLESLGISYYPSRYWAIAVPCYAVVTAMLLPIGYFAINCMITENLDSFYTVTDEIFTRPEKDSLASFNNDSVPRPSDLSLTHVNRILYFGKMEDVDPEKEEAHKYMWEQMKRKS